MQVWSLGWEDPLEKETATHSSILAWRIPWTEKPGGLWSIESQRRTRLKRQHRRHKGSSKIRVEFTHLWGKCTFLRLISIFKGVSLCTRKKRITVNHKELSLWRRHELKSTNILCFSGNLPEVVSLHTCSVASVVTPWTVAHQAPLSMGFSRKEYWSELLCPPPGDLLDPGVESKSLTSSVLAGRFFTTSTYPLLKMVFKVVSWAMMDSFTQFPWVSPMYTEEIDINKLVFFPPINLSLITDSLSQELRRVKGNLFFLAHVVIQGKECARGLLEPWTYILYWSGY